MKVIESIAIKDVKAKNHTIHLSEKEFEATWEAVKVLREYPNVLFSICIPGECGLIDTFSKKDFLKAISHRYEGEE